MTSQHADIAGVPASRTPLIRLVESRWFNRLIMALIIINAVTLGLETELAYHPTWGSMLYWLDKAFLSVFTIEVALKLVAYRQRFFSSGWNWFDFIIVGASWLPASGPLAVLRAFRIFRVLRLFSVVPQMRKVIGALGHSLPGIGSILSVLGILFYVSAVLVTKLFGQHPDPNMQEWFGTIGASAYTLFQIMTLESWSMGIVRPTMELFPYSWLFFVPFIIVTSFAVLNLFIGIIVDAMQVMQDEEKAEHPETQPASKEDMVALQQQLIELRRLLEADSGQAASKPGTRD
ncbi:Sodium channel protein type 4 subunit alpha A [Saliniradius amylolyticus]|uniref:Sodium channel protein type 4 subunit alpha A n=1 Tax=Saliniradius amylolyticus TaxID=2183582 RepID=A0A2S2E5Z2_9ALTE|nr:ion transporter [Saliniradius amylolyticus]AWL13074.1 Sodium channel protein type 4 subunit alpha A [Saliniradius amylolyticus]